MAFEQPISCKNVIDVLNRTVASEWTITTIRYLNRLLHRIVNGNDPLDNPFLEVPIKDVEPILTPSFFLTLNNVEGLLTPSYISLYSRLCQLPGINYNDYQQLLPQLVNLKPAVISKLHRGLVSAEEIADFIKFRTIFIIYRNNLFFKRYL